MSGSALELFISTFTTLFVIMDPPGNMPIFLGLTSRMTPRERVKAAIQAVMTSFGVLTVFALFGKNILGFLHITEDAMRLSGGLLLLIVALQLLTGKEQDPGSPTGQMNMAIVPLGMPLMAGPGTIVASMVAMGEASGSLSHMLAVGGALILVHIVCFLTYFFAVPLNRLLGDGGITLLTRLSGMLLAAIATQLMIDAALNIFKL